MTDPFSTFEELRDWPGKKRPVNRPEASATVEPEGYDGWDKKPVVYVYGGTSREFFTIGHLADALGRSPVTIRSWESKGALPKSPYRSPRPRGESLPGKESKGKRLWTRAQIEGIIRIARDEQVIFNNKPPTQRFTQRVADLFRELIQMEKK
jgi:hypothetical protein